MSIFHLFPALSQVKDFKVAQERLKYYFVVKIIASICYKQQLPGLEQKRVSVSIINFHIRDNYTGWEFLCPAPLNSIKA